MTGNSDAKLEITPENVCRFYGNVCKDLPPIASEQAASGYAGMRSKVWNFSFQAKLKSTE